MGFFSVISQYNFCIIQHTLCIANHTKNNYFNIRHVQNEQLNHSLEFSAPTSFKFVTNYIYIALPLSKVNSFGFYNDEICFCVQPSLMT